MTTTINTIVAIIMFVLLIVAFICSLPVTFIWMIYACAKNNMKGLVEYYDGLFKLKP